MATPTTKKASPKAVPATKKAAAKPVTAKVVTPEDPMVTAMKAVDGFNRLPKAARRGLVAELSFLA